MAVECKISISLKAWFFYISDSYGWQCMYDMNKARRIVRVYYKLIAIFRNNLRAKLNEVSFDHGNVFSIWSITTGVRRADDRVTITLLTSSADMSVKSFKDYFDAKALPILKSCLLPGLEYSFNEEFIDYKHLTLSPGEKDK